MLNNRKILKYSDLKKIKTGENNNPLVSLNSFCPDIICRYQKKDMLKISGPDIFVRKAVALKLCRITKTLQKVNPDFRLKVVYGYRHPDIQEKYFKKVFKKISLEKRGLDQEKIKSLAHLFVAVPEVAGHPTGGALDISIENGNQELDMGTSIADFSQPDKIKTFAKGISREQRYNRNLLRQLLMKEGFAPFNGEWWHFSYGDKEWASFYGKKKSLYSSIIKN